MQLATFKQQSKLNYVKFSKKLTFLQKLNVIKKKTM